jgi:1-aminocyclopropane-1-carboxylate deaminase
MLAYSPTPVQEIHDPVLDKAGVRLFIRREDLNHPYVSGNKWWKLKYNLEEAKHTGKKTLLTFGGAYSNHIYATAAASQELGFESVGIIRGEETLPLNHTLSVAKSMGMRLHYVTRGQYRKKTEAAFMHQLRQQFGDFYLIPEGGTNELAVKGCIEFAKTLGDGFDYICCSVGTGGTLAGIINGLPGNKTILGFSSLKGGEFLQSDVERLLHAGQHADWKIITGYPFGGYGKTTSALEEFKNAFEKRNKIPLDPVYTAKMMAGVFDLVQKNMFKKGSTLLAIHTGGLQGNIVSSAS